MRDYVQDRCCGAVFVSVRKLGLCPADRVAGTRDQVGRPTRRLRDMDEDSGTGTTSADRQEDCGTGTRSAGQGPSLRTDTKTAGQETDPVCGPAGLNPRGLTLGVRERDHDGGERIDLPKR